MKKTTKKCKTCGEVKDIKHFSGRKAACKKCYSAEMKTSMRFVRNREDAFYKMWIG